MRLGFLLFMLVLTGCTSSAGLNMAPYRGLDESPEAFYYCYDYGCTQKVAVSIHEKDWRHVTRLFHRKSKNAEEERAQIAKAVARMEQITGKMVGTSDDQAKAPILKKANRKELDCIDETINTTKYLEFFEEAGLLSFHTVGKPAFKGFLINGVYPHNTATIIETHTGKAYAIDSYIRANGQKPVIRPLDDWLKTKTLED